MALAATSVYEVQTGGDDTNNGGIFDPGQTAGMFTDGAATSANTSAPVFTSASYNFVAGDANAWVYIASGTNWTPGWYKIASVAANAATLTATIGTAVLAAGIPTTVVGCATVASPTGATWSIDYSQQTAAEITYTDLASVGAGLLVSSVANPFASQQVGNSIVITGGTNFTTGRYVIASVAVGVATVIGAADITTGVGANGTGGLGGALASPGQAMAHKLAGNTVWIATGTYTITTTTQNVSGGKLNDTQVGSLFSRWEGYGTVRGDLITPPTIQVAATGVTSISMFNVSGNSSTFIARNLILDGLSKASIRGYAFGGGYGVLLTAKNCTDIGCWGSGTTFWFRCIATGCSSSFGAFHSDGYMIACEAYANSVSGFNSTTAIPCIWDRCLSYGNTGASSDGFNQQGSNTANAMNCVAYNNGRDGFRFNSNGTFKSAINCIAESNTGFGFGADAATRHAILSNNATYNNTGGSIDPLFNTALMSGNVIGSGSFFTNAAAADFSLNNTAGAGAILRGVGIPGVFPVGLTTGHLDIGAAQHADAGGGGIIVPTQAIGVESLHIGA